MEVDQTKMDEVLGMLFIFRNESNLYKTNKQTNDNKTHFSFIFHQAINSVVVWMRNVPPQVHGFDNIVSTCGIGHGASGSRVLLEEICE